ncbi:methylglutaconyl-CoA hydratase [Clonorchis sinensis]|uniref:Methylglutaconyl-CoA hydratase n=2 Tax=Clonorchis sinensis TaxID=79923 RepID=H2KQI7_CLOSI|nr:methylglutaconyl-CoA hydratase [Clonorchis sinensis]
MVLEANTKHQWTLLDCFAELQVTSLVFRSCTKIPGLRQLRYASSTVKPSLFDELKSSGQNVIVNASRGDGIAILAMNFQAKKNALSKVFVEDFSKAVSELEKDDKSIVAVVCSLVPNVFCAGADLKERAEVPDEQTPALVGGLRSLFQRIYALPFPVVAAVDGSALGGGLELALACDVRFVGNLPRSQIGLIETHWALLPGAGGSQRLPRLISVSKAKELMFAARRLNPVQAAELGIANAVVNPDEVPEEWKDRPALYRSLEYASELTSKGPVALRQLKRAVNEGLSSGSLERGLEVEGACYRILVPTRDRKEGMKAFAEKRTPIYHGH